MAECGGKNSQNDAYKNEHSQFELKGWDGIDETNSSLHARVIPCGVAEMRNIVHDQRKAYSAPTVYICSTVHPSWYEYFTEAVLTREA